VTDRRTSPLHQEHVDAGASFTDFAGWEMPVRYSSDLAEHHAVRRGAGLFDLSHMGEIRVSGPDAGAALDGALAGSFQRMAVGRAKYTMMLAPDGGIVDDLVVYRLADDAYLVVANASNRDTVAAELSARAAGPGSTVRDDSDATALVAIQGPAAEGVLARLPGLDVPGLDSLRYYRVAQGSWSGHDLLVARTGYTGEDGFELYLAPNAAPGLWRALLETGAERGLVPAGLASRDTLRLEAGMPLYGHELSRELQPAQAGLGRVVDLESGAFVGRAAAERGPAEGAPVLVGLVSEGRRAGRAGYAVHAADGAEAGVVTSGALSPTLGHPVAMALVDPAHATPGTSLAIDVRGSRVPASVVPLPFYTRGA